MENGIGKMNLSSKVYNKWFRHSVNSVWHVFGSCIIAACVLQIILICNMADAPSGAWHCYLSEAPDVTSDFFVGIHIGSVPGFVC